MNGTGVCFCSILLEEEDGLTGIRQANEHTLCSFYHDNKSRSYDLKIRGYHCYTIHGNLNLLLFIRIQLQKTYIENSMYAACASAKCTLKLNLMQ